MNGYQKTVNWLKQRPDSYADDSINVDQPTTDWEYAFPGIKKLLFHILIFASILGNLFDLHFVGHYLDEYVRYINYIHVIFVAVVFILFKLKLFKLQTASNIVIYTIVINIFSSLNYSHSHFSEFFFRETIFLGIVLVIAGIIDRNNTIIIGVAYFMYYVITMIYSRNTFLLDNAAILILINLSYVIIMYHIISSFQRGYILQQKLTYELNESNKLLDKQKKLIEDSEIKYRMLADNAGDFIAMYDGKGKFTYTSPAVSKILGFAPNDMLFKNALELVHENDLHEVKKCVAKTILGIETVTCQYRAKKIDGKFVWVEAIMQKINNLDNCYLAIIRDISQRKKDQLELELANQTKDKFFSIIAHDLKSPMAQIFSSSNLLHERYQTLNEEDKHILIEALYKGSEKISSLLDDLLLWSRSQMNKIEVIPVKCNIHDLMIECLQLFKPVLESKRIVVKVPNNQPTYAFADINSVKTVIRNVFSNAIKFSHTDSVIEFDIYPNEKGVEIKIMDNGIGISVERISSLFQIDKSFSTLGTQNETGTGLGMIICKELIEKNKGQLSVESEVNKGTTFKIILPLVNQRLNGTT